MTDAIVPASMMGKMGRSHEGMKLVSLYVCEQKRKEYWKLAREKVMKVYAQNATAMVVTAQARLG